MGFFDWFKWKKRTNKPEVQPPSRPINDFLDDLDDLPEAIPLTPDEQLAFSGEWLYLSSTNVHGIKYNWNDKTMDVEYQFGRFYTYFDVPPEFFIEFVKADSPGSFVWEEIRRPNKFGYIGWKVPGATRPPGGKQIQVVEEDDKKK
jgi:hypothetical protein